MATTIESPADAERVREVARFGWALVELRGRYRLGSAVNGPHLDKRVEKDTDLPLSHERCGTEQRIETVAVVEGLAESLGFDFKVERDTSAAQPRYWKVRQGGLLRRGDISISHELNRIVHAMNEELEGDEDKRAPATGQWDWFTALIWRWDAQLQDMLALKPAEAAAYQAARGLAEVYWALDPEQAEETHWSSWEFLLGDERRAFIKRQVARLSPYLDPLTPVAIYISLDKWGEVARDKKWRRKQACGEKLFEQVLLWRDLLRGERNPNDLIAEMPQSKAPSISWPLIKTLLPQLSFVAASIALLVGGIYVLANTDSNGVIASVAAIVGSLGITGAGLYARAKTTVQSAVEAFRDRYSREVVGPAATITP